MMYFLTERRCLIDLMNILLNLATRAYLNYYFVQFLDILEFEIDVSQYRINLIAFVGCISSVDRILHCHNVHLALGPW